MTQSAFNDFLKTQESEFATYCFQIEQLYLESTHQMRLRQVITEAKLQQTHHLYINFLEYRSKLNLADAISDETIKQTQINEANKCFTEKNQATNLLIKNMLSAWSIPN